MDSPSAHLSVPASLAPSLACSSIHALRRELEWLGRARSLQGHHRTWRGREPWPLARAQPPPPRAHGERPADTSVNELCLGTWVGVCAFLRSEARRLGRWGAAAPTSSLRGTPAGPRALAQPWLWSAPCGGGLGETVRVVAVGALRPTESRRSACVPPPKLREGVAPGRPEGLGLAGAPLASSHAAFLEPRLHPGGVARVPRETLPRRGAP